MLICATGSLASMTNALGLEPAPVKLGFFDLVPTFELREEYDSNLYRQAENDVESWVQVMMLNMQAVTGSGPHRYGFNYRGEGGLIDANSEDNYFDQSATLGGKWDFSARHRFELLGGYKRDHDRRGTRYFEGDLATLVDEPPRYREEMFLSRYSYGADGARGRLDFEVKGIDKKYLNFRELLEGSDLTNVYGSTTFYWRVAGDLRGLVEAKYGKVNYQNDPREVDGAEDKRDSNYTAYLAGVTWDIAGKTTGTLKVGHATKDFSDRDRKDFSGSSWSGEVAWSPVSYSTFLLTTGRAAEESHGRGDYIDTTDWGVAWNHKWNGRIESRLHYSDSDETYEADPEGRDDTVHRYGLNINYTMRRWLVIGMFYTREERESNIAQYDFPRDFTGLTLQASL